MKKHGHYLCAEEHVVAPSKARLSTLPSIKMRQIAAGSNPSFLFLHYEPGWRVANLFAVLKNIFRPGLIQPRRPLPPEHPRAGHILSNIRLNRIPLEARVHIIQHRAWRPQAHVQEEWQTLTSFGRVPHKMRGWTLDVYNQITQLPTQFSLQEAYTYEEELGRLHPIWRLGSQTMRSFPVEIAIRTFKDIQAGFPSAQIRIAIPIECSLSLNATEGLMKA